MKLIWRIILRITLLMLVVLPLWGFFFYKAVLKEVNDETDDNLELYAEQVIRKYLSKQDTLALSNDVTNNSFTIERVEPSQYEDSYCVYDNEMIYVPAKEETEPARVLRMTFSDTNGHMFLLTVLTPTLESNDLIEAILNWIAMLFLGLLLVIVAILAVVLWRSIKPLHRLLLWIDNYRLGEDIAPLENPTSVSEFQRLNKAAIGFAARNEKLFSQQKQFIGNASHEIQTPIAVCQNRLEVLCDMDLTEAQMTEVIKTRKTLEYISRLNKSLLFLTKIENRQFIKREMVDVNEILGRCIEDYLEIYSYKNITTILTPGNVPLIVDMNRTLATSLVSNLVRNAFVHNFEGGTISITFVKNTFAITNTGQLGPLDKNHIFEPFWHTSRKEVSTGLGLSVVRSIAEYYGFNIAYDFVNGKHEFSINFGSMQ